MSKIEVAYLGPKGTYSHLVAEKRFGIKTDQVPLTTVHDICSYVSKKPSRRGIVPIENSSGGAIYETVDILLANDPPIHIEEELSLNVKLALLGKKNSKIKTLYSHFAPLEHCAPWIRKNLPCVARKVVTSTAVAAQRAADEDNSGSLGSRKLAQIYKLDILKYPVEVDIPNITTFLVISGRRFNPTGKSKTTVAIKLPNKPGSLCDFLDKFRAENVNLSRLISRPIRGCPKEYAFLVDLEGSISLPKVKRALAAAKQTCAELRIVGSFPALRSYKS
jgi:prephenate dehydratase